MTPPPLAVVSSRVDAHAVRDFHQRWDRNPCAATLIARWQEDGLPGWRCWDVLLRAFSPCDATTTERALRASRWLQRAGVNDPDELEALFAINRAVLALNLEWYCLAGFRTAEEWAALARVGLNAPDARTFRTAAGPGYDGVVIAELAHAGFSPAALRAARSNNRERLTPAPDAPHLPPLCAVGSQGLPVKLELVDGWELRISDDSERLLTETYTAFGGSLPVQNILEAWWAILRNHPAAPAALQQLPDPLRTDKVIHMARLRAISSVIAKSGRLK